MSEEKKPTPKKRVAPKKKKAVAKPKIVMLSYTIGMTIPTVQYGNITPQIVVKGGTVEECHDFVAPHMNKLWKEYYMVNGKRPEPTPTPEITPTPFPTPYVGDDPNAPVTTSTTNPEVVITPVDNLKDYKNCACTPDHPCKLHGTPPVTPTPTENFVPETVQPPASSVALVKATQAIDSCMSADALKLIIDQVYASVKLTEEDKVALAPMLDAKHKQFNN